MSLPLVWVVTDLGPADDQPAFLVSAVAVTTQGYAPGQVWADSASPFTDPDATLTYCEHEHGFMTTDEGLLICSDCTERFHPAQFPRTDPRLIGDADE